MTDREVQSVKIKDIKLQIQRSISNPNVRNVYQMTLKNGPQTYRFATIFEIVDPKKNQLHHYALRLDSFKHTKKRGWEDKPEKQITLESTEPNELDLLVRFIQRTLKEELPKESGLYHIIGSDKYERLSEILQVVQQADSRKKMRFIKAVLSRLAVDDVEISEWLQLFEAAGPELTRNVATAARLKQYKLACSRLKELIHLSNVTEPKFQSTLEAHPWMFGSEYSELVPRRTWTRDDDLDFMLRRTVDGFLEIVEIKTPYVGDLFLYDKSHDSWYPASHLSRAVGQTMRYIEEVERARDIILAKDNEDTLKIRARLIIGRDGGVQQQQALRNFNYHLHRIEVFTFDQLLRIANRVLNVFEHEIESGYTAA